MRNDTPRQRAVRTRWTAKMDRLVRECYERGDSVAELGRQLGVKAKVIKSRANRLGLTHARFVSPEIKEQICKLYPTHTAEQIAEKLGLRAAFVYEYAAKCGLKKTHRWPEDIRQRVKQLNLAGWSDTQIAQEVNLSWAQVNGIRDSFGLPTHSDPTKRQRSIANQRKTLGVKTAGELRAHAYRKFAQESGWPEDLGPRAVQILNLLAVKGVPMHRVDIFHGIGIQNIRKNTTHTKRPAGSWLAVLARRGLVTRLRRAGIPTKGRAKDLYTLGPEALRLLQEKAHEKRSGQSETQPAG